MCDQNQELVKMQCIKIFKTAENKNTKQSNSDCFLLITKFYNLYSLMYNQEHQWDINKNNYGLGGVLKNIKVP